jgi:2-succinyl-6-hydroxy-2,4-cyclohexadiene-1-carboxylate synthase
MDGAADLVRRTAEAEGTGRFALAGYSMGGRLALHLALRHPEAVTGLALISASPGLRSPAERTARRALDAQRATDFARDPAAFAEAWTRLDLFQPMAEAERAARAAAFARNAPDEVAQSLAGMGTGAQPSHWEHLTRLRVGALAVVGSADAKYLRLGRGMAEAGPVTLAVIAGAGHALPATHPAALADALAAHLDF